MGDPEYDRLEEFFRDHRASSKRNFKKFGIRMDEFSEKQHESAIKLNTVEEQLKHIDPEKIKDEITGIVDLKLKLIQAETDTTRARAEVERLNSITRRVQVDWAKVIKISGSAVIAIAGILTCVGLM